MDRFVQDLLYSLRQFRHSPGFAITAILSLTLGIGATTAIFSVVYGVLLDPYPYKDAQRMVHVELRDKTNRGGNLLFVNGNEYPELHKLPAIEDVFLMNQESDILGGGQFPVSVDVGRYSPNLFEYMGVPVLLGRGFSETDATDGKVSPVAVLSYVFWKRQYGGDQNVLGRSIDLNHKLYTVIGVTPPRFTWGDSDVYVPGLPSGDPHEYWMSFIKLKPGANHKVAEAQLQSFVDAVAKPDPKDFRRDRRVVIASLNEEVMGKFEGTLVLLFAAVIALLLIGCGNISILLLARGSGRQHELTVRASVGASRKRLVQQLLTEAVLLALAGAALGVAAAYFGVRAIASLLPFYSFPHEAAIHVSVPVLAFSAGVAVLTGILFGISPAWQFSRPELAELMQASSARHSGGGRVPRTHRLLIAAQVALTLLIMAGAGAAMKSFQKLLATPLGFDPTHGFSFRVEFPKGAQTTWEARLNANEAVRQAVAQAPGVSAAVSTSWFPPFGGFNAPIEIHGKPELGNATALLALVSPQVFSTLHVPVLSGRVFDDAEVLRAAHVALVNEAFAKQFFGGGNPIGASVRSPLLKVEQADLLSAQDPDQWLQVIGVVGNARNDGLDRPTQPAVFLPYSFVLPPDEAVLARGSGDPDGAITIVKQRLRELNPELVVSNYHPLEWWLMTRGWGRERFIAILFSLFAGLALVLAATGLYSVVSYAVTQRTREVGIRMMLGSPRASIIRLVLGSTALTFGVGVAAGVALSLGFSRVVNAWSGANPRDPVTLALAALLLAIVAATACVAPAWRAATVDPMKALRME